MLLPQSSARERVQLGQLKRREFLALLGSADAWPCATRHEFGGSMETVIDPIQAFQGRRAIDEFYPSSRRCSRQDNGSSLGICFSSKTGVAVENGSHQCGCEKCQSEPLPHDFRMEACGLGQILH
jgi:hypothetical protein